MIDVLIVRPGLPAEPASVDPTLETFQDIVQGYIALRTLDRDVALYCNEEGERFELPICRLIPPLEVVLGPFVVFGGVDRDGRERSLTRPQLERWRHYFDGASFEIAKTMLAAPAGPFQRPTMPAELAPADFARGGGR